MEPCQFDYINNLKWQTAAMSQITSDMHDYLICPCCCKGIAARFKTAKVLFKMKRWVQKLQICPLQQYASPLTPCPWVWIALHCTTTTSVFTFANPSVSALGFVLSVGNLALTTLLVLRLGRRGLKHDIRLSGLLAEVFIIIKLKRIPYRTVGTSAITTH